MSVTLLLTTIAAQVGSAYFNSKRSKAQSAELAEQQQRLEEKIMLQGIENSREEYVQVCALQREIEQLMQKDRLELIQQNYINSIELDAYNVSLEHWPLFTPPYVIKGQLIDGLSGANSTDAIPLNCIMTTSMHTKFNQKIFPQLEENLALFCSKHWNSSQRNSIRFYQNAWRDNIVDLGSRIKDLYAHLDDIPTIVLSPVVRNGKITFKIYWWGISRNAKDQHNNDAMVYDPELSVTITDELALSEIQINSIVDELSNKLSALISYFADQYYWNFYRISPSTPSLIRMDSISLSANELNEYRQSYVRLLSETTDAVYATASHNSWGMFSALYGFVDEDEYAEGLRQFIKTKQINNSLSTLDIPILTSMCALVENSYDIKKIINDAICFINHMGVSYTVEKYEERFNLVVYLQKFKNFLDINADRFNLEIMSLYIQHNNYTVFNLRTYNTETKKIMSNVNSFDYTITTKRPLYDKKIRNLFKYKNTGCIICRYRRIDELINKLVNNDTLIF